MHNKKFWKKFSSRAGREKIGCFALFRERKFAFSRFLLFGVPVWKFSTQTLSPILSENYSGWRFPFFLSLSQLFWDSCRSICSRKVLCQVRALSCFEITSVKWEIKKKQAGEWKRVKTVEKLLRLQGFHITREKCLSTYWISESENASSRRQGDAISCILLDESV